MSHLLVFGYGYTGSRIGSLMASRGWQVTGTRTTSAKASEIVDDGVSVAVFDGRKPSSGVTRALRGATHVLSTIGPDDDDPVLRHHRRDLEEAACLRWMGYLSTTGVYGDWDGAWVDESAELEAGTERSRQRIAAEDAWRSVAEARGVPLQLFRLSGIYGPQRSALDRLRDGSARRIVGPAVVFNRSPVDDIVGAVMAGMERPSVTGALNVSDDEPAPPADVVEHAAGLLAVEPPPAVPLEEADLSSTGRSFYEENKRVSNQRLVADLGYTLRYPTYREGLAAILRDESGRRG